INALARKSKQWGHLPGVGRVLPERATDVLSPPPPHCTHNSVDVEKLKKKKKYLTKQVNLMMKLFISDDKFSQMLNQYESSPEFGNASGCGDDKMADDEEDDDNYKLVSIRLNVIDKWKTLNRRKRRIPKNKSCRLGLDLSDDGKGFRTRSIEVVKLIDLLDEAKTPKATLVERGFDESELAECIRYSVEQGCVLHAYYSSTRFVLL
nr:arginine--tRNA ligase, cytoplasmic-like isoform X1 [Tanacetum cinerariifolium]